MAFSLRSSGSFPLDFGVAASGGFAAATTQVTNARFLAFGPDVATWNLHLARIELATFSVLG